MPPHRKRPTATPRQAGNSRASAAAFGRRRQKRTPSTNGTALDLAYSFNLGTADNRSVASISNNIDSLRNQNFTYDQFDRLATGQTNSTYSTSPAHCRGETFNYDIWGNFLSIGVASSSYNGCTQESLSVSVTPQNQLGTQGFQYDTAGNMTNDGAHTYVYNGEGQIKTGAGVNYTYDGDGRRVEKSNGTLYWYGAGSDALDETDLSGNLTNEYIYFAGRRVARRDSSGNIYFYFEDHLGTSRVITNAAGTVCYDADFYPYGGERVYHNTCPQNYKFTGKERDAESGLDDMVARFYSSGLGRFVIADWSASPETVPFADFTNPQTLNLYAYVKNNPLRYIDPTGHMPGSTITALLKDAMPGVPHDSLGDESDSRDGFSNVDNENQNQQANANESQPSNTEQNSPSQPQYLQPQNEQEAKLSNVIYNEIGSLRPTKDASAEVLHNARVAIGEVAITVTTAGHPERVATSDLNKKAENALAKGNPDAIRAHNDSLAAARQALAGSKTAKSDTQYRVARSDMQKINRGTVNLRFGPFWDTLTGGTRMVVFAP